MKTLRTRLVLSHLAVTVIVGLTAYAVVRVMAPAVFDDDLRNHGGGNGQGRMREVMEHAVHSALLAGLVLGVVVATVFGLWASAQLLRPILKIREATHQMAAGEYDVQVDPPSEGELAALVYDVNQLGATLHQTEQRRMHLIADVAHEMRTPLAILEGYVEGMVDGVLPVNADTLDQLHTEVDRLTRLAEDLSGLSRAQENGVELDRERFDLASSAAMTARSMEPQFSEMGLTLLIDDIVPLTVDADPGRVGQIVTNLVANALKATPAGGEVRLGFAQRGERAEVFVSDTGEGLAAGDQERVFERFYRVPGARRAVKNNGSGIGLTICRSLARAHGGDVTASSPGKGLGATFVLSLPLADE